jgi:ribosomal-protein-alanine N-acetyltransferase
MKSLNFPKSFPRIETERLILREITDQDRQAIFRNFSDPEVAKWFFEQPLTEMDQVMEIIIAFRDDFQSGKGLTWAIELKRDSNCVGTCGYGDIDLGQRGEIGFDLAKEHWGKGLMSEALAHMITYGFDVLGLSKVEAHCYSTNSRAINLLEKLGFYLEKVFEDSHYYCISKDDFERSSP